MTTNATNPDDHFLVELFWIDVMSTRNCEYPIVFSFYTHARIGGRGTSGGGGGGAK
jgi:hypothetical protein